MCAFDGQLRARVRSDEVASLEAFADCARSAAARRTLHATARMLAALACQVQRDNGVLNVLGQRRKACSVNSAGSADAMNC